jgi:hypothetical protein
MKKIKNQKEKEVKQPKTPYWEVKRAKEIQEMRAVKPTRGGLNPNEAPKSEALCLLQNITANKHRDTSYTQAIKLLEDFDEASQKRFVELYQILASKKWTDKFLERTDYILPVMHIALKLPNACERVRDWKPASRNADKQVRSLLDFLFVKYEMPEFFYDAWFKTHSQHIDWFITLAKGGSVRDLKTLPVEFTKKMAHEFMQAPAYMSISEALRYAQVIGFGGDATLAWYVNSSYLGRNSFASESFWSKVIQFFAQVGMFEVEKLPEIIDYIQAQYTENRNYSMKGRTISALLRQTEEWHAELRQLAQQRAKARYKRVDLKWDTCGIYGFTYETGNSENKSYQRFTIRELLSSEALREEGREQHHCVSSYDRSCADKHNAIFTMHIKKQSMADIKAVTIQVRLTSMEIVQAKGARNRSITPVEREVIERWANREYLSISKFL